MSTPAPAYAAIVDDLRGDITTGVLEPGAKIPSERELCERYAVSAITARRAVQELRAAGLVVSQQGRGVYVREHRPLVRIAPWRYWRRHPHAAWVQEAETSGRKVTLDHTTVHICATGQLADRLGIAEGDTVVQTEYLVRMDGEPVSTSRSWEPGALTIGTSIADPHTGPIANRGIVPRFDSIGHRVSDVHEDVEARMPTHDEARRLEVPPGVPLMVVSQTFYAGDTAVEAADILIPASRYTLSFRMRVE